MAAKNRKYIYYTCIFGYVRNRNEIPMVMPTFSRSGNTTEVLRRMPDVRIRDKSKMAAYNRKYI